MIKTREYLNQFYALTISFLLLGVSHSSFAIDPASGTHELLSADIDSDGDTDYLFRGKDSFLILHGDIAVPIPIDHPDVMLQAQSNGTFAVVNSVPSELATSTAWSANTTTMYTSNINGDGYTDTVLLASGSNHRGVILHGENGTISVGGYINAGLIGEDAYSRFDTMNVYDSDGNGTDDLVFYQGGTAIALAYSNGNSFSTVAQQVDTPDYVFPGQWSNNVQTKDGTTIDIFTPTPPNAAGISINNLQSFNVSNRPAFINNFGGTTYTEQQAEVTHGPAKIIVIVAHDSYLTKPIKILGSKADLFIITKVDHGGFTCQNCSFEGVLRLSILTRGDNFSFSADTSDLGSFKPTRTTYATINNLKAPGVIGVDIVTSTLHSNASVDLFQKVRTSGTNSSIVVDEDGNKTIANGALNILLGAHQWDYHSNKIVDNGQGYYIQNNRLYTGGGWKKEKGIKTVSGHFKAKTVRISSSGSLTVSATAETVTDFTSTVSYRGEVFVPEESVDYQALAGYLTVSGITNSAGDVRYKSKGRLNVNTTQNTSHGKHLKVVSEERILIPAGSRLVAENITLSGADIANSGTVRAAHRLEIHATNATTAAGNTPRGTGSVYNQYGGELIGSDILIDARNVIRNGSRTPYASTPTTSDSLFNPQVFNNWIDDDGNAIAIGTFYHVPGSVDVAPTTTKKASNQKAHIAGDKINMKATAIENINPYYLFSDGYQVDMQRDMVAQVAISAEDELKIKASSYILNTSSLLSLNKANAALQLNAPNVINNRYRVAFQLKASDVAPKIKTTIETMTENVATKTALYSPPGVIRSTGKVTSDGVGATSQFRNIAGYIEVFGELDVAANTFHSEGWKNQVIAQDTTTTSKVLTINGLDYVIGQSTETSPTIIADPNDLDSLLYAGYGLKASDSDVFIKDTTVMDLYIARAIEHAKATEYSWVGNGRIVNQINPGDCTDPITYPRSGCRSYAKDRKTTTAQNGSVFSTTTIDGFKASGFASLGWTEDHVMVRDSYRCYRNARIGQVPCGENDRGDRYELIQLGVETTTTQASGTGTMALYQMLDQYYETIKSTNANFSNEFKYWN